MPGFTRRVYVEPSALISGSDTSELGLSLMGRAR
jgi:hypothetical protein